MLFFLVIVVVPFILLVVSLYRPDLVENILREPSVVGAAPQARTVEEPEQTLPP